MRGEQYVTAWYAGGQWDKLLNLTLEKFKSDHDIDFAKQFKAEQESGTHLHHVIVYIGKFRYHRKISGNTILYLFNE